MSAWEGKRITHQMESATMVDRAPRLLTALTAPTARIVASAFYHRPCHQYIRQVVDPAAPTRASIERTCATMVDRVPNIVSANWAQTARIVAFALCRLRHLLGHLHIRQVVDLAVATRVGVMASAKMVGRARSMLPALMAPTARIVASAMMMSGDGALRMWAQ